MVSGSVGLAAIASILPLDGLGKPRGAGPRGAKGWGVEKSAAAYWIRRPAAARFVAPRFQKNFPPLVETAEKVFARGRRGHGVAFLRLLRSSSRFGDPMRRTARSSHSASFRPRGLGRGWACARDSCLTQAGAHRPCSRPAAGFDQLQHPLHVHHKTREQRLDQRSHSPTTAGTQQSALAHVWGGAT